MRHLNIIVLIATVAFTWQPVIANAQDPPVAEGSSGTDSDRANIDRVESEFEDLLLAQATDFSSPAATLVQMSRLANRYLQPDERFNEPIRQVLQRYSDGQLESDEERQSDLDVALSMFELTTFPADVGAKLLFQTMLSGHPEIKNAATRSRIKSLLSVRPNETSALVLAALRRGEASSRVLSLTSITGKSSAAVAVELLQLAKRESPENRPAILAALAPMIEKVKLINQLPDEVVKAGTDAKHVAYARRIIARHDQNEDGRLTFAERESIPMSLEPADANKDGAITVAEYANWMASRDRE